MRAARLLLSETMFFCIGPYYDSTSMAQSFSIMLVRGLAYIDPLIKPPHFSIRGVETVVVVIRGNFDQTTHTRVKFVCYCLK